MRERRWNCMNSWNLTFRNNTGNFITVKPEYCGQSIVAFDLFSQPNLWVQISSVEKSDASSLLCLVRFVSSQSAKRQIGTRDNVGPLIELWFCFWKLKSFVTIERFDMNLNTSFWRNWASKLPKIPRNAPSDSLLNSSFQNFYARYFCSPVFVEICK